MNGSKNIMNIPEKMKAIKIKEPGGSEVLQLHHKTVPKPGFKQILIKIAFAGVNRPDVLQRMGLYQPPKDASKIPGLEASGTVVALGSGCSRWKIGDQVTALLPGGGYSEYAVTHEDHALSVPTSLSLKESAGLCETFFTVWSNVFMRGKLRAGETFLVHGGTSGIGTTAIQLASVFGAKVFTTAGSDEKCKFCINLGAHHAVNYKTTDFYKSIREINQDSGIDLILDMVGGEYIQKNIKTLANEGRLIQIAFLEGAKQQINFSEIMLRRLVLTGSTLRPQSDLNKSNMANELRQHVWPLIESGRIKPVIDQVFPLDDVQSAHKGIETDHIGKILLSI